MNISAAAFALFLLFAALPAAAPAAGLPEDAHAAVVLVYNRIGEDEYPASNIRLEQFAAHIDELKSGGYTVLPLPAVVAALRAEKTLPDRTVAITFDGGYRSALKNAVPLLREYGLPYTVFVAPDHADQNVPQYMNWDDLRALSRDGLASIGLHPASYTRLDSLPEEERARQVNKARARFREKLGQDAALFAYPFGGYSLPLRDYIESQGFAAAFGQQSGAAWGGSDPFALPRFPMTEAYGDEDRFRMIASALPLPVADVEPADPRLATTSPPIGFTLGFAPEGGAAEKLSCFVSGQGAPRLQAAGSARVELRLEKPLSQERARINCTMPGPAPAQADDDQRWRWFGMLLLPPGSMQAEAGNAAGQEPAAGVEE